MTLKSHIIPLHHYWIDLWGEKCSFAIK